MDTDLERAFLYTRLADDLERQIRGGVWRTGDKIPSVRTLKRERGVSLATVTRALREVEARGLICARPRSGYFVAQRQEAPRPELRRHRMRPRRVPTPHLADDFIAASADARLAPLGGAVLSSELLTLKHGSRLVREVSAKRELVLARYGPPAGAMELRRVIAKRLLGLGLGATAEDVVVSSGCMNAIQLALRAVTKPGDTVVVESPTFFGFLALVRDLGLYALEVPTHPEHGIDLRSLASALQKHRVRAILVTPTFQNPTGAAMSDDDKRSLAALAGSHGATIIEDDVYGDLPFADQRPAPLLSLVPDADVVFCTSFSKTLTPGLRVGYLVPGRHVEVVKRLKLSGTIASPPLNQLVVAEFLESGAYQRHLRGLRGRVHSQVRAARRALSDHLPDGTEVTLPRGGFLLWVRLPGALDTLELYHRMKSPGVSFLPGALCALDAKYASCLRISAGHPWTAGLERAIETIGRAARA